MESSSFPRNPSEREENISERKQNKYARKIFGVILLNGYKDNEKNQIKTIKKCSRRDYTTVDYLICVFTNEKLFIQGLYINEKKNLLKTNFHHIFSMFNDWECDTSDISSFIFCISSSTTENDLNKLFLNSLHIFSNEETLKFIVESDDQSLFSPIKGAKTYVFNKSLQRIISDLVSYEFNVKANRNMLELFINRLKLIFLQEAELDITLMTLVKEVKILRTDIPSISVIYPNFLQHLEQFYDERDVFEPDSVNERLCSHDTLWLWRPYNPNHFQLNLLKLFLLHSYQQKDDFRLSADNQLAGYFDDVVYETSQRSILLQAKHTQFQRVISYKNLFPLDSYNTYFSIHKYLKSFTRLAKHFKNIEFLSLCTNSSIDLTNINLNLKEALLKCGAKLDLGQVDDYMIEISLEQNHILSLFGTTKCYMFNPKYKHSLIDLFLTKTDFDIRYISIFLNKFQIHSINPKHIEKQIQHLFEKIDILDKTIPQKIPFSVFSDNLIKWYLQCRMNHSFLRPQHVLLYVNVNKELECLRQIKEPIEFVLSQQKRQNIIISLKNPATYKLHLLKIIQILASFGVHDGVLFIDHTKSIDIQAKMIRAFDLPEYSVLVITLIHLSYNDLKDTITQTIQSNISKKNKSIVFLTTDSYLNIKIKRDLGKHIDFTFAEINEEITFNSFSHITQKCILEKKIIFNDCNFCLKDVVKNNPNIISTIFDEVTLHKIVLNDSIQMQSIMDEPNYETYDSKLYISRFLKIFNEIITENEFLKNMDSKTYSKVVLLVGDAGMGKTTFLSRLQYILRNKPYWIFKINLWEFEYLFKAKAKDKVDHIQFEEFLTKVPWLKKDTFERKIFYLENKVIVLIDGIDQICPSYSNIYLNTLYHLTRQKNIANIIVGTRPYIIQSLLAVVSADICNLVPISKLDATMFIYNYWKNIIDLNEDSEEDNKYKTYAENLIKKMEIAIPSSTEIPLEVRMMAECFLNMEDKDKTIDLISINLYKNIIEKKFEPHKTLDFKTIENEHIKKSIKSIFDEIYYKFFKILDTSDVDENMLYEFEIITEKEGHSYFCHRTYAEYFVAKHICDLLKEDKLTTELAEFITKEIFLSSVTHNINILIDNMLKTQDIRKHVFEIFGTITENIQNVQILKLAEDKRNTILMLMLAKCSKCNGLYSYDEDNLTMRLTNKNENVLDYLIKHKHHFKNIDSNKNTILHLAVLNNLKETVRSLVKESDIINQKNNNGDTPLHLAVEKGYKDQVQLLIENGHPADDVNNDNETPLLVAIRNKEEIIANMLLPKTNNLNIVSELNKTVLHLAVKWNLSSLIAELLDGGVNREIADIKGNTALHEAVKNNNLEIVKILLKRYAFDINKPNRNGDSPLHLAVRSNQTELAKYLLANNAEVLGKNLLGNTALHEAVDQNAEQLIFLLYNRDKERYHINKNGDTPLHLAVKNKLEHVVRWLLNNNCSVQPQNFSGDTPLHIAVSNNSTNIINLLTDKGHSVNVKNNEGNTPLHLAAKHNLKDLVKHLLEIKLNRKIVYNGQDKPRIMAIDNTL
ncbi:uncharacterized protein [Diabrotica undecimpunctata]|uniref:uncharacterized protein n=1 Tax=Diabrotica undecimpunctata TaxID=50387 RepID=UPI003B634506